MMTLVNKMLEFLATLTSFFLKQFDLSTLKKDKYYNMMVKGKFNKSFKTLYFLFKTYRSVVLKLKDITSIMDLNSLYNVHIKYKY